MVVSYLLLLIELLLWCPFLLLGIMNIIDIDTTFVSSVWAVDPILEGGHSKRGFFCFRLVALLAIASCDAWCW